MIPQTNDIIELSIYADYLEDQGKYNEAKHLREELLENPDDTKWCWDHLFYIGSPIDNNDYPQNYEGGGIFIHEDYVGTHSLMNGVGGNSNFGVGDFDRVGV